MPTCSFNTPLAKRRIERIQELLEDMPMTPRQVADKIHVCYRQARSYLTHLHGKKRVYIKTWRRDHTDPYMRHRPMFAWGRGIDAVKPKALDSAARERRRRLDPKIRMKEIMDKRAKRAQEKAAKQSMMEVA